MPGVLRTTTKRWTFNITAKSRSLIILRLASCNYGLKFSVPEPECVYQWLRSSCRLSFRQSVFQGTLNSPVHTKIYQREINPLNLDVLYLPIEAISSDLQWLEIALGSFTTSHFCQLQSSSPSCSPARRASPSMKPSTRSLDSRSLSSLEESVSPSDKLFSLVSSLCCVISLDL